MPWNKVNKVITLHHCIQVSKSFLCKLYFNSLTTFLSQSVKLSEWSITIGLVRDLCFKSSLNTSQETEEIMQLSLVTIIQQLTSKLQLEIVFIHSTVWIFNKLKNNFIPKTRVSLTLQQWTSFICMTIRNTYSIAKAICLGLITTQGNYVTLIIICHEHQNKLKCILWIVYW